jgi:hypothetical protein
LLLYGQEEIAEIEKETHRLAVVNMDWRYVKVRIRSIMCFCCGIFLIRGIFNVIVFLFGWLK